MNLLRRTNRCMLVFSHPQNVLKVKQPLQAKEYHKTVDKYHLPLCASCISQGRKFTPPNLERQKHTPSASISLEELSTWQRVKWNMGLYGNLQVPKRKLYLSGYHLYICCTDFVDFPQFVKDAGIPDTFSSWFQLTLLHMWLLTVKLSQMGLEGVILKDMAYKAMWQNIEVRLDTYKDLLGSEKRQFQQTFYNSMVLSIMYLDEGLIGSDMQLANALWISMYAMSQDADSQHLEHLVAYVRKQVKFHDELETADIMFPGYIPFLPLHGEKLDKQKAQQDYQFILSSN